MQAFTQETLLGCESTGESVNLKHVNRMETYIFLFSFLITSLKNNKDAFDYIKPGTHKAPSALSISPSAPPVC